MQPTCLASIRSHRRPRTPVYIGRGAVRDARFVSHLLRTHLASRHVLVSDERVYWLHGRRLEARLRSAGVTLCVCVVPPVESSKSMAVYVQLADRILAEGIDRGSHVLTIGGGMVNNLGGFLAATLHRGIRLIHLPSSLMAQLDAAIDLRQAINHPLGKNLIGALYAPSMIVVDPQLLDTLPVKHLRSGIAEAVKHALTQSPSLYRFLMENAHRLRDAAFLEHIVKKTIRLKLSLLNAGNAASHGEFLMQYGHCVGHALETATGYALLHGEAVAIGMVVSAEIAAAMGICSTRVVDDHSRIMEAYRLPTSVQTDVRIPAVMDAVAHDKHRCRNTSRLALLKDIGRAYRTKEGSFAYVSATAIQRALSQSKRRAPSERKGTRCSST